MYQPLQKFCPGDHEHEAWGFDHETATFNTAKEAEYPDGMCQTYANILQNFVQIHGIDVYDFMAKSLSTAPQVQKRGRRVPQLIPEFLWTKTVLLPDIPPLDHKKCLLQPCADLPAGCKLLRTEANKGRHGDLTMCVFGCFHSMQQVVSVAKQLWHPYDELRNLPDPLVKNLFWYLSNSPATVTKHRIACLGRWRQLASELRPMEEKLHAQMDTDVAGVLSGKNILLMRQIAEEMGWPDQDLFSEMPLGFELTGNFSACGVFKAQVNIPSLSVDQLDRNTKYLRPAILGRLKITEGNELHDELHSVTETERSKGWLSGPHSTETIASLLGEDWLPVRRFGVKQKSKTGSKTRPIDDFRENTLNLTFGSVEKPELRTMDHVLWALVTLASYLTFHERMNFQLSDGTYLTGEVHADWKKLRPVFKTTCVDLQSAYKQLAVHPKEQKRTVVTLWNKKEGRPCCYISKVLPFGASASVHHFLRVSAFLQHAGLHMGLCWAAYFDDFAVLTHECHETSRFHQGTNKKSRIEETVGFLAKILTDKKMVLSEMPSKLGKLQYAETQIWGRAGRLALADMRELLRGGSNSVSLDERTCKAVELLKEKLSLGRPRTLRITKKKKPIVLFTDGSLEYEEGLPVARIGGVCLLTDGTNLVFGAEVSSDLLQSWTEGGEKEHVIGLVEMYAVLVALHTWADHFAGERNLLFVDNWPVVDALVKGVSTQSTWRDLLMVFEIMDEKHQSLHWVGRVPSASNPADPPSRGTLKGLEFLGDLVITECNCPISNKQLKRIVNVNAEAE
eukprot:s3063_g9.t1